MMARRDPYLPRSPGTEEQPNVTFPSNKLESYLVQLCAHINAAQNKSQSQCFITSLGRKVEADNKALTEDYVTHVTGWSRSENT
jgi:hypothetical protein